MDQMPAVRTGNRIPESFLIFFRNRDSRSTSRPLAAKRRIKGVREGPLSRGDYNAVSLHLRGKGHRDKPLLARTQRAPADTDPPLGSLLVRHSIRLSKDRIAVEIVLSTI
jgi:hypothetical protein